MRKVSYESTVTEGSAIDVDTIADFAEAGVTWWLHGLDLNLSLPFPGVIDRVRQGPPQMR